MYSSCWKCNRRKKYWLVERFRNVSSRNFCCLVTACLNLHTSLTNSVAFDPFYYTWANTTSSRKLGTPLVQCCFSRLAIWELPDNKETKCDSLNKVPVPKFLKSSGANLLGTIVCCKQLVWALTGAEILRRNANTRSLWGGNLPWSRGSPVWNTLENLISSKDSWVEASDSIKIRHKMKIPLLLQVWQATVWVPPSPAKQSSCIRFTSRPVDRGFSHFQTKVLIDGGVICMSWHM